MIVPRARHAVGAGKEHALQVIDLDDPRAVHPLLAGGKASLLALARARGLAVLPGLVVTAPSSRWHMAKGVEALSRRGSGGARLEVSRAALPADFATELTARARGLAEVLVVRSSSVLEAASEWSGAFTSYLDVRPEEVPRAVTGCWASAFGVATLDRHAAAGVEPGSADMAVLVQPALEPDFGGTARLEGDEVLITAVSGSPAPLVQGWEPGTPALAAPDGTLRGDALERMGGETLRTVATLVRRAHDSLGATGCEWAIANGEVFVLQLTRATREVPAPVTIATVHLPEGADEIARLVRRSPGPLGESLVLPWAVADPAAYLEEAYPLDLDPAEAFRKAVDQASHLTAQAWSLPGPQAARAAAEALRSLRGTEPRWSQLSSLRPPDRDRGRFVLRCLATVRQALVEAGAVTWPEVGWHLTPDEVGEVLSGHRTTRRQRIGYDRWEPFNAAVVMANGESLQGTVAAPGIGSGRACWIAEPHHTARFRPRDVVVAPYPTPNLAALLWDAAGVVTIGGGPAAHLFESARALAIPAVCGVRLDGISPEVTGGDRALAVDGTSGTVHVSEW